MRRRFAIRSPLAGAGLVALATIWTGVALISTSAKAAVDRSAQGFQQVDIPKGTHTLIGRVLDAGTGAPVAGAVVTIQGFFDASGQAVPGVPRTREVQEASLPRNSMTNGDGYFVFRDLPSARYAISALAFGYVSNLYPMHVVEVHDSSKPADVVLRLAKYAAITGTVVDERGEPIVGAQVNALQRSTMAGALVLRRQSSVSASTDDRGVYRLAELPPGSYLVGVLAAPATITASVAARIDAVASNPQAAFELRRELMSLPPTATTGQGVRIGGSVLQRPGPALAPSPDGRVLAYPTTFAPGTANVADATIVTLGSGEERSGVDFPLRALPTVRVSGGITGPAGPIANLAVRLVPPNGADLLDGDPAGVAMTLTDDAGAFTFVGITPGTYRLKAWAVAWERPIPNAPVPLWASQTLTIGDSDITGLAVPLRPGIPVSGRVEFKGLSGPAPSSPNGFVMLRPVGAMSWSPSRGPMAADGAFRTQGDPPGKYLVNAPYVTGWTLHSVSRGGRVLADDVIELDAEEITGLVITMTKTPLRVSGAVTDAKGVADAATDVIVFPADTAAWREGIFNARRVRLVHATSAGSFEIPELAPGEYHIVAIRARAVAEWQDPQFLESLVAGATKLTLGDSPATGIQLKTFTPRAR